jgi:regulatory protein
LPEENTASSNGEDQNNKRAKIQKINARLISTALEITPEEYEETFQNLADRTWENSSETNALKRERNFVITYCVKGLRVI